MEAIFSSKLYRASNRKERINAALLAPGNLSLVQQLDGSLDKEYQSLATPDVPKEKETDKDVDLESIVVDEEIDPETDLVTVDDAKNNAEKKSKSSHSSSHRSAPTSKPSDFKVPDAPGEGPAPEDNGSADVSDAPKPEEPKEAEASTKVVSCDQSMLTILKESLNNREDTHGVARIAEKENEVWIYYKDDINLNNIMTEVIEYIMISGYTNLEFNRLARTDNAIVFQESDGTLPDIPEEEPQDKEEILEEINLEEAPAQFREAE